MDGCVEPLQCPVELKVQTTIFQSNDPFEMDVCGSNEDAMANIIKYRPGATWAFNLSELYLKKMVRLRGLESATVFKTLHHILRFLKE